MISLYHDFNKSKHEQKQTYATINNNKNVLDNNNDEDILNNNNDENLFIIFCLLNI